MHTDQVQALETEVPHPEIITGQVPATAVPHRVIPSQRLLIAGPVITAAAHGQALHTVVTDRAQAQAGHPIPLQEAAHPEVAAAIGLPLQEAVTGLLAVLLVAAADRIAAEAVEAADHLQVEAAADHLPAVAGPAVEEGNTHFILSYNQKIDSGLIQGNYI